MPLVLVCQVTPQIALVSSLPVCSSFPWLRLWMSCWSLKWPVKDAISTSLDEKENSTSASLMMAPPALRYSKLESERTMVSKWSHCAVSVCWQYCAFLRRIISTASGRLPS